MNLYDYGEITILTTIKYLISNQNEIQNNVIVQYKVFV